MAESTVLLDRYAWTPGTRHSAMGFRCDARKWGENGQYSVKPRQRPPDKTVGKPPNSTARTSWRGNASGGRVVHLEFPPFQCCWTGPVAAAMVDGVGMEWYVGSGGPRLGGHFGPPNARCLAQGFSMTGCYLTFCADWRSATPLDGPRGGYSLLRCLRAVFLLYMRCITHWACEHNAAKC